MSEVKTRQIAIMGEVWDIVLIDSSEDLDLSQFGFEKDENGKQIPLYGLCDSGDTKIYICKNLIQNGNTIELTDKEIKRTITHELAHAYFDEMSYDKFSQNEELIEIVGNIIYRMFELDFSYETTIAKVSEMLQEDLDKEEKEEVVLN
jgi:hypothetical protein